MKSDRLRFASTVSFLFLFVFAFPALSAERGIVPVPIKDKSGKQVGLYKESHALLIGASEYTGGWPRLPGVLEDIREVKSALEGAGFNVVVVRDPDRDRLDKAFADFINKYGRGKDNRLLIYFAGHGHTMKLGYGGEMGYIVPVDAPDPNRDEAGFLEKAMDMQMIEVYARRIQSKHAVFLFDSCFSGSLFALTRAIPQVIQEKTALPVRQFITAGTADQEVPDESIFRKQFVRALQGDGDLNKDGYVTVTELGQYLEDTVTNYSKRSQTPKYGKIRDPLLDRGDFVFPLKAASSAPPGAGRDNLSQERQRVEADRARLEEERKKLAEEKRRLEEDRRRMEAAGLPLGNFDDGAAAFERKDYAAALRNYKPLAERGDARAQHNLGFMYENGLGVPQDHAQAVAWFRKAAEQGFADGQVYLAYMYENGLGVPQDLAQAVAWYRKAAEQGHAFGQYILGVWYETGTGVPQDLAQAIVWYRKAAEQGYSEARVALRMLENR